MTRGSCNTAFQPQPLPALQRDLLERGLRSRSRVLASGRTIGNVPFTNGPLSYLLKNRLYLGEINHKGIS